MPHAPKKALKIRRALKTAARLPTRRNHSSPAPGEQPVVFLRVQVLGCQGLSVRGKSGNCDPFVVVSLLNTRHHTPTSKRTPNPTFSPKDATFDFPIYLSLADRLGTVEVVVWDRETMITKEYLGEVALGLGDWFGERDIEGLGVNGLLGPSGYGFGDDGNKSCSMNLVSTRASTHVSGSVQIKLGFVPASSSSSATNSYSFEEVFAELVKRSRPSLVSAPPTEGIGTLRSHLSGPAYEDDGGISSDEDGEGDGNSEDDEDEDDHAGHSSSRVTSNEDVQRFMNSNENVPSFVGGTDIDVPTLTRLYMPPFMPQAQDEQPRRAQLRKEGQEEDSEQELSPDTARPPPSTRLEKPASAIEIRSPGGAVIDLTPSTIEVTPATPVGSPIAGSKTPSSPAARSPSSPGRRTPSSPGGWLPSSPGEAMPSSPGVKPLLGVAQMPASPGGKSPSSLSVTQAPSSSGMKQPSLTLNVTQIPSSLGVTPTPPSPSIKSGVKLPRLFPRRPTLATSPSSPSSPHGKSPSSPSSHNRPPPSPSSYAKSPSSPSSKSRPPSSPSTYARSTSSPVSGSITPISPSTPLTPSWSMRRHRRSASTGAPSLVIATETGTGTSNVVTPTIVTAPPTPVTTHAPITPLSGAHTPVNAYPPVITQTPVTPGSAHPPISRKKKLRKSWASKKADYNFSAANDIVGIVMLEIQGAADLPRLKNMTRTGWDMDPFVVISFGKKVFRTRVIRHSLNPVWDEKMLFHVRRYETSFKVQLTVLDWDKLSSNDYVGDARFDVAELVGDAPQPDPRTGLYADGADGGHPMKEFQLPLTTAREMPWEAKHAPVLTLRAKYQPYDALRQRFWSQYLTQYDVDDTGAMSHLELTSMLDSLGSTLSAQTIDSFFTRFGKRPLEDELTIPEAIICLETELGRPNSERKRLATEDSFLDTSLSATPLLSGEESATGLDGGGSWGAGGGKSFLDGLDFSGPPLSALVSDDSPTESSSYFPTVPAPAPYATEPSEVGLTTYAEPIPLPVSPSPNSRQLSYSSSTSDAEDPSGNSPSADTFERVINVKNCPLCHRPRLNSKAEVDIVTHLAICASQDWAGVDRIVVGNFVTASQAQRKWYTKILSKVSSGDYKLGANSANIIVQNRMTGQLEEEKMQVYVRLGIRLLYKGARSRMEGARARRLLKSLSVKQGIKYDSPESARGIPAFVQFHGLKVDEILEPINSFKTFNEFFYRKLKPSARPIESPDDPARLVSAADCRLMVFETVSDATRLWIKGREFTVARLLGSAYQDQAERYTGGALAIFRLAPQDYHRFHVPVDGTIGPMTDIAGEYYTVNPQAIRSALDVYGENVRKIVPIDSPQFGRVVAVCIGAMMVGSIKITVEEGEQVKRGQELGYFAFGGSTIVVLFEKGMVEWDEDLIVNGRASLETLVRVGMGIGRCPVRRNGWNHNGSYSGKSLDSNLKV